MFAKQRVLFALLVAGSLLAGSGAALGQVTYTTDADFDGGPMVGVQHETYHDQLQLAEQTEIDPYIYIANHRYGTVSKVDTRTGYEVARYPSCVNNVGNASLCPPTDAARGPHAYCDWAGKGHCPSRTAVDLNGDIWVANRAFGAQGSVTKIAGSIDRCVDRNHDGVIQTSSDLDGDHGIDVTESAGMPTTGTGEWVGQADECVLFTVAVGYTDASPTKKGVPRALAVAPDNDIWVGMWNGKEVIKIANSDGHTIARYAAGANVYGLAADAEGYIYSAATTSMKVIQMRASDGVVTKSISLPYGTYGLAAQQHGQVVWYGIWGAYRGVLRVDFSPATPAATLYPNTAWSASAKTRGVALDDNGFVWVANYDDSKVGKFNIATRTWVASYSVGAGPIGCAIDSNDMVWTTGYSSSIATRINPATGARLDSVRLGVEPYSYSDMTGYQLRKVITKQGTWNITYNGGRPGTMWATVSWNQFGGTCPPAGCIPGGTEILVQVRAGDSPAPTGPWTVVENGVPIGGIFGQYIEVQAMLRIISGAVSPVLTDLSIQAGDRPPVCAPAAAIDVSCTNPSVFTTRVSVTDPDGDPLTYEWTAGTCGSFRTEISGGSLPNATFRMFAEAICDVECAVAVRVRDEHNEVWCNQPVRIVDDAPPVLATPAALVVECTGGAGGVPSSDPRVTAFLNGASATDVCRNEPVSVWNDGAPALLPVGTTTVQFHAADACGNTADRPGAITVADTAAPVLTVCPPGETVNLDPLTCAVERTYTAQATDECGGVLSASHTYRFTAPGTQGHTYVLTDAGGHSVTCTQTVTAVDASAPVVDCPANAAVNLDPATCGATATYTARATDACGGGDAESHTFTFTAPGSQAWTYTLTDGNGNTATCTQTVTAVDATAPVLTCPADADLVLDDCCFGTATYTATSVDACSGPSTASHTFTFSMTGTETWTYTVTDGAGNTGSCVQTVTAIDTWVPYVDCPADIPALRLDPATCTAVVTSTATGWDWCRVPINWSYSHTFRFTAPGTQTYTYPAFVDPTGNVGEICTQTVTAVDTAPPVYTKGPAITLWPPNHKYVSVKLGDCGTFEDSCGGPIVPGAGTSQIVKVSSDEPEDARGDGDGATIDDMIVINSYTVGLRAERQGAGNGRAYTINFKIKDPAGNYLNATCRVDVPRAEGKTVVDDGPVYWEP